MTSHTQRKKNRSNWALKVTRSKPVIDQLSPESQKVIQKLKKNKIQFTEVDLVEMRSLMDEYAVRGMHLLWDIIADENHEWHRRFGFEALKILIQHTLPKRRDLTGQVEQNVDVNLASLFHNNNIESVVSKESLGEVKGIEARNETVELEPMIEIDSEVKEGSDDESEGSGSDC